MRWPSSPTGGSEPARRRTGCWPTPGTTPPSGRRTAAHPDEPSRCPRRSAALHAHSARLSRFVTGAAGRHDWEVAHQMSEKPRSITVVGQGYVGLPVAMRAVEQGYNVV